MTRKRWRAWRRAVGLLAAGLVVLALAGSLVSMAYGRMRLRAATRAFEARGGSLNLASYEQPEVPSSENAAAWLEAGASVIDLDRRTSSTLAYAASRAVGGWDADELQTARATLAQNATALAMVREATEKTRASFAIPYREGFAARIPPLARIHEAATLLRLEGRLAAGEGNREVVLAAARTLRSVADVMAAEPQLIVCLTGFAVERDLLGMASDLAIADDPRVANPDFLRRLAAELPQVDRRAQLRRSLQADVAATVHALGGNLATMPPRQWLPILPIRDLFEAITLEVAVASLDVMDTPRGDRHSPQLPDTSGFLYRHLIIALAFPRMVEAAQLVLAQRQLTSAALRLRARALEDGRYPRLEELPTELRAPNPYDGRPLAYTLGEDGSARLAMPGESEGMVRPQLVLPALPARAAPPAARAGTRTP